MLTNTTQGDHFMPMTDVYAAGRTTSHRKGHAMNRLATVRASRKGWVALGLGAAVAGVAIFGGAATANAASAPAPKPAAHTTGGGTTLVEVGCPPGTIAVKPVEVKPVPQKPVGVGAGDEKTVDNPHCKGIAAAILGTWLSKDCETVSQDLTRRRTYVFRKHDVAIAYVLYGGAGCNENAKLFTVTTHGTAAFVGPSATVAGASNVLFTFKSRAATPTTAGLGALQNACPQYHWAPGVSVDLSKDGCGALVQSNTECPIEYDLAAIVSGVAYFGDRSHSLCTEATRPTKLASGGVVRKPRRHDLLGFSPEGRRVGSLVDHAGS
jgi:hypothetical protein